VAETGGLFKSELYTCTAYYKTVKGDIITMVVGHLKCKQKKTK